MCSLRWRVHVKANSGPQAKGHSSHNRATAATGRQTVRGGGNTCDPVGTKTAARSYRTVGLALALGLFTSPIVGCSKSRDDLGPNVASRASSSAATRTSATPLPPPPRPEPKRPYNVIVIVVDAMRADMPWAGYPRDIAPRLSEFAKRSVLYPRGYALSSYTAKSVAPMLTGRYPSEMPRDGFFFTVWLRENVFLTERLQEVGHRTTAGNGHGYFLPAMGLNQGFDDYRLLPGTFLDTTGVHDITSERMNVLAKEILSDPKNVKLTDGKRFFSYFHFLDPHYTYIKHEGHPDFGNNRRDLYDNEIHFTDKWVGDLIDWIERQPWADQTALIITGDHGEGFGEHGQYRHAYELWESLVRVPLIMRVPGAEPRRIEAPRSHIDLAPTILDLMGVAPPTELPGKSLVPEIFGDSVSERDVLVDLPRCDLMDRRRALIHGQYKLLSFGDDALFQLYDVVKDFAETNDLSKAQPELLERMKKRYAALSDSVKTVPVVGSARLKGAPVGRRW